MPVDSFAFRCFLQLKSLTSFTGAKINVNEYPFPDEISHVPDLILEKGNMRAKALEGFLVVFGHLNLSNMRITI